MMKRPEDEETQPTTVLPPPPTMAPHPVSVPQAPAAALPKPLPGMPPSVGMSELEPYLNKQKQAITKYGPSEQMALQENLNQRHESVGNKLTSGAKGFADALMMGVARAGNPNWQGQYDDQERQLGQDRMNTLQKAHEGNLKEVESGMNLDAMNPGSEVSKASQEAYGPLFAKLGYPPEAIKGLSGAKIDNALSLMTQMGGAEVQAMIKQYELEIERMRLKGTLSKQASDEEIAKDKGRTDAASELLKRTGNARIWGIPIPFTSDVSGKEEKAAKKVLMDQMNPPEEFSEDDYNALPSGSQYVGPDGKKRIKK